MYELISTADRCTPGYFRNLNTHVIAAVSAGCFSCTQVLGGCWSTRSRSARCTTVHPTSQGSLRPPLPLAMHCRLLAASVLLLLMTGALGGATKLLRTAEMHDAAAASRRILQKQGPVKNSECLPAELNWQDKWYIWIGQPDNKKDTFCTRTKYSVHYCCTKVTKTHFTGCEKADYSWKEPYCWPDEKTQAKIVRACCTR